MGLLLISHDLAVIASACTRVYVMYGGQTVEWGPTGDVFSRPSHPYTAALLQAARVARNSERRFATIEGDVPNLTGTIADCPFEPRCAHATHRCHTEMPEPMSIGGAPDHQSRCWLNG